MKSDSFFSNIDFNPKRDPTRSFCISEMKAGSLEIANSVAFISSREQANGVTRTPSSTKTLKHRAWQHVGACIRSTPFLRLLLFVYFRSAF